MKRKLFILFSTGIILSGCTDTKEFKKEDALKIINKELNYPKVVDYDIYCSDPAHANKLLDAGLEENGIVLIQKTQKLKDIGSLLIEFTDMAKPYLLATSDKDKKLDIQKVKIAEEVVTDIKILVTEEQTINVEYTTGYRNITPFAILSKTNFTESKTHTVSFISSDKGWILKPFNP